MRIISLLFCTRHFLFSHQYEPYGFYLQCPAPIIISNWWCITYLYAFLLSSHLSHKAKIRLNFALSNYMIYLVELIQYLTQNILYCASQILQIHNVLKYSAEHCIQFLNIGGIEYRYNTEIQNTEHRNTEYKIQNRECRTQKYRIQNAKHRNKEYRT